MEDKRTGIRSNVTPGRFLCASSSCTRKSGIGMVRTPVGVFQPADEELWNAENDFSLWRSILRELAEELGGATEDYKTHRGPIDYRAWPFANHLTQALDTGQVRAFCLASGLIHLPSPPTFSPSSPSTHRCMTSCSGRSPTPTPKDQSSLPPRSPRSSWSGTRAPNRPRPQARACYGSPGDTGRSCLTEYATGTVCTATCCCCHGIAAACA